MENKNRVDYVCVNDLINSVKFPAITKINIEHDPSKSNIKEIADNEKNKKKQYLPTVIVSFSDDTVEKAVTKPDDVFSLEQGISICLMKKLLALVTGSKGSNAYNRMLHYGMKFYKKQQADIVKKAEAEQHEKELAQKYATKRAERIAKHKADRERRIAERREYEIAIHTEAYIRALRAVNQEQECSIQDNKY